MPGSRDQYLDDPAEIDVDGRIFSWSTWAKFQRENPEFVGRTLTVLPPTVEGFLMEYTSVLDRMDGKAPPAAFDGRD